MFFLLLYFAQQQNRQCQQKKRKNEWSAFFPECFLPHFKISWRLFLGLRLARLLLNNLITFTVECYLSSFSDAHSNHLIVHRYHLLREIIHYHFQLFLLEIFDKRFFRGFFLPLNKFYIISVRFFVTLFNCTTITQHNDYSPTNFIA